MRSELLAEPDSYMKQQTPKQRLRDVRRNIALRNRHGTSYKRRSVRKSDRKNYWKRRNLWLEKKIRNGLNAYINEKRRVILRLPDKMNFSDQYESTVLHLAAIRKLSETANWSHKAYRLASVNFDSLQEISMPAALMLTAELSKWDDAVRQRLRPSIDNWSKNILKQFFQLGFFDLFSNKPEFDKEISDTSSCDLRLVKYIKGRCGDDDKTKILKQEIHKIVGENIDKWTFLHSGLTEAITNVSQHAYPENKRFQENDKNWYLSGSFNCQTNELKIVCYDQGIGIPRSLPASGVWEQVLSFLSTLSAIDRKRDEVMLKAAVEMDRTSTLKNDRGKGLQDLLEFTKQRGNGYLSIMSKKGLYKYSIEDGLEKIKTVGFQQQIDGTLIIWYVVLDK